MSIANPVGRRRRGPRVFARTETDGPHYGAVVAEQNSSERRVVSAAQFLSVTGSPHRPFNPATRRDTVPPIVVPADRNPFPGPPILPPPGAAFRFGGAPRRNLPPPPPGSLVADLVDVWRLVFVRSRPHEEDVPVRQPSSFIIFV